MKNTTDQDELYSLCWKFYRRIQWWHRQAGLEEDRELQARWAAHLYEIEYDPENKACPEVHEIGPDGKAVMGGGSSGAPFKPFSRAAARAWSVFTVLLMIGTAYLAYSVGRGAMTIVDAVVYAVLAWLLLTFGLSVLGYGLDSLSQRLRRYTDASE